MPKVNGTAKQSSKQNGAKKKTTTKAASEPVREADVAVTMIRMLLVPTPYAPRFDPEAPIENNQSDSDDGFLGDVDLNYEDDYLCQDLGEDSDDNEDANKQAMTTKDCLQLKWKFELLTEELKQPNNMYSGPGLCLRRRIGTKFQTLLQSAELCGGLNRELIKKLTANSNQYVQEHVDTFESFWWRPMEK